jgi:uncharacterized RDD family membrane protein YckC
MPPTKVPTPPLLAGCKPAPLGLRAAALAMDLLLVGLAALIIIFHIVLPQNYPDYHAAIGREWQASKTAAAQLMAGQTPDFDLDPDYVDVVQAMMLTSFTVFLAYFAISEISGGGTTLGKRLFHLRAAQWGTGAPPHFVESLFRCVFKCASLVNVPVLLLLDTLPAFFRPSRRALHDYVCRTIVTNDPMPLPPKKENQIEGEF